MADDQRPTDNQNPADNQRSPRSEQRSETGSEQRPDTGNEQRAQTGNNQRTQTPNQRENAASDEKEEKAKDRKDAGLPLTSGQPVHPVLPSSNYEAAFELTGYGQFNKLGLAACSLIFIHSILEMVAIAYVVTPAECDLRMTVPEKSMINSATFIGIFKTAICWGAITDRFGRRKIIIPTVIGAVISSFISSLCMTFWTMFIFRLITGYMISASSTTILVYLGEIYTTEHRDTAIAIAVTTAQCAFIVVPAFAWMLIPGSWSFSMGSILIRPWRVFMWSWGLVGLAGAGILFILPESPRFVLAAQGPFATQPILAKMYAWNYKRPPSEYPITAITTPSSTLHSSHERFANILRDILQLIKPPMLRCFILTHYCMFMVFFLANGLYMWMPDFINEILKDTSKGDSICDLINNKYLQEDDAGGGNQVVTDDCSEGEVNMFVYPTAIVMELIYLAPFATVIYYVHKYDKIKLYVFVMLPCAVGLLLCAIIPQIIVAMFFIVIGLCSGSAAAILSILAVDVFPTSLRGLAMCTMYMAGHLGGVVGTSIIAILVNFWCYIIFFLMSLATAASALTLFKFWPNADTVRAQMEAKNFTY